MSSQQMSYNYGTDSDEDYDYQDQYDLYDDFSVSQSVMKNTTNKKKDRTHVYSQKHIRNYTKKYNK